MAKTNGDDSQDVSKPCEEDKAVLLPELPDDIVYQILPFIPTKFAFRISLLSKQFEGAWCSGPEIELDEGSTHGGINFTNVLKRYLKSRTESKDLHPDWPLLKFRVRMAMDDPIREDILEELLIGFAKERSIKVLDVSCLTIPARPLSSQTFLHIKSLTSLSLESLRIKGDVEPDVRMRYDDPRINDSLFPFLKTLSLKSMQLPHINFMGRLILRCPSLENLIVTSCCFDLEECPFWIPDSDTHKFLEFKDCKFRSISVGSCRNIETFTSVSESPEVKELSLFGCVKLKKIKILEKHLQSIEILHPNDKTNCLKIEVDTPNLTSFRLGSLSVSEDIRHKCIEGQCRFTHFFESYYTSQKLKMMGIDPSSLFR